MHHVTDAVSDHIARRQHPGNRKGRADVVAFVDLALVASAPHSRICSWLQLAVPLAFAVEYSDATLSCTVAEALGNYFPADDLLHATGFLRHAGPVHFIMEPDDLLRTYAGGDHHDCYFVNTA